MKKITMVVTLLVAMVCVLAGCSAKSADGAWNVVKNYSYSDIAAWGTMQTPVEGSGSGSVVETNDADGFVTIQAAEDGWGGLESEYIEFDLTKEPMVFAQIFENPDGCNWGMKIVPEGASEDHAWGLYLVPDNNLKWNKYAGVKVTDVLDEDFRAIYGDKVKAKIWVFAAGGPEATVSVSEIKVVNTK